MKKTSLLLLIVSSILLSVTAEALPQISKVVGFKISTTTIYNKPPLGKTVKVTLHVKYKLKKNMSIAACNKLNNTLTINWNFEGANSKVFDKFNYPKIGTAGNELKPLLASTTNYYIQPGFDGVDKKNNACLYSVRVTNRKKQSPSFASPIIVSFWAQMQRKIVENQSNVIKIKLQKSS